jgi:DNA-binding transcriptional LysR family regulator
VRFGVNLAETLNFYCVFEHPLARFPQGDCRFFSFPSGIALSWLSWRAMYDWAEFRHFRYLLKILEKRGFRPAAEELFTSQPNLTVQARQFQDNASVRLFHKTKSGQILPTKSGTAFIVLVRSLLEFRDEVIDALVAIERNEINTVRLGSTPLVDETVFRGLCKLHKELLPECVLRPTHGDTTQLAQEVLAGQVDAAIVTLPLTNPNLHIEDLRCERIVACLRKDHPLAAKAAIQTSDLVNNLTIFYHPQRHPDAHKRLLELLGNAGVFVEDFSRASHPSEMQNLVREGHGLALIREGTVLLDGLITRSIIGVDWTVDTAIIYRKNNYPRSIPPLVRTLKRQIMKADRKSALSLVHSTQNAATQKAAEPAEKRPVQLSFEEEIF